MKFTMGLLPSGIDVETSIVEFFIGNSHGEDNVEVEVF